MAFIHILAGGGTIYAVTGDGSLLWYRDELRDGTNGANGEHGWAALSGSAIGAGWQEFPLVAAAGGGVLYAVGEDGQLVWFRDELDDGSNGPAGGRGWAPASGSEIGSGWDAFRTVVSGGGGVLYAIDGNGDLLWYRDELRDGTNGPDGGRGWAPGSGSRIGSGWDAFRTVVSGGGGVLYAIDGNGNLLWYRDDLRNGTNGAHGETGWAPGSGTPIGSGWGDFRTVVCGGAADGILYAVTTSTDLLFYRDDARDGSNGPHGQTGWAEHSGSEVGVGWSLEARAFVTGYAWPLSVRAGDTVDLMLSTRRPASCTVEVLRLRENPDATVGVDAGAARLAVEVEPQAVPVDAWRAGCGWSPTTHLQVDPAWTSGLYSARVTAEESGDAVDVVFVVRPAGAPRDLLLIANTNTWNAYNAWGGASNYSGRADVVQLSFTRPNPETAPSAFAGGSYVPNHLTAAEIWLSTWLEDAGYAVDTCSDLDFDRGDPDPAGYRAVVLSTHPEYWSHTMAQRLSDYLAGGGNLLYWGGNGIFRQVQFADDGSAMTTGIGPDWYCGNAWPEGPKPRELLGVAYDIGQDLLYPRRCGYLVEDVTHPFFAGTSLVQGQTFGTAGRNGGGACGWEADTATDFHEGNGPAPADEQVLGRGELSTAAGYAGHMTYYRTPAGGFVFAIGSITFGGALVEDRALQQVARNALDACLA